MIMVKGAQLRHGHGQRGVNQKPLAIIFIKSFVIN